MPPKQDCGHVRVVDPWLEDDGTNCIYDDYLIIVMRRDSLDQLVATEPWRELISGRHMRIFLSSEWSSRRRHCSPVAWVAVHTDVTLARTGQQKYDCHVLLHRSVGSCIKVEVVEVPRELRMIQFSLRLECRVWLSTCNK